MPEPPIPWNATINGIWTSPVSGEPLVAEVNPSLYDADEYIWYIDGNEIERTSTNYLSTYNWICKPKQEVFWVISITSRGPTVPIGSTYTPLCTHPRFTLSPNPATDEVTLQLTETDEVSGLSVLSTDRSTYEIQIWSGMRMLRSFRTNEPTFQIPMAGLPAGLYFVRVIKDGQTYTQKLIKK